MFKQTGVVRVDTIDELIDTLQAFDRLPLPGGGNLFLYSQAGGPGIYCTDAIARWPQLKMPLVSDDTKARLAATQQPMANICHPEGYADITASASVRNHVDGLQIVLQDENVDAVVFITVVPTFLPQEELARELVKMTETTPQAQEKPVFYCVMAGAYTSPARRIMEQAGLCTFAPRTRPSWQRRICAITPPFAGGRRRTEPCLKKNTAALNERDSSSLLSSCGVRMVASVLLDKPDRAAFEAASRQLGFPVAMKVLSDDILHKTDVGCVVLNVTDVDGMQAAYDTIMANAAKNAPRARVQGVLAEQMLPKGFEVLLGVSTDPQFGHVIMAGLGGVLVELLHAVSLRVLPITRQDAEDMIDETPLAKACQGLQASSTAGRKSWRP